MKITVCGKGGCGKSTVSALLTSFCCICNKTMRSSSSEKLCRLCVSILLYSAETIFLAQIYQHKAKLL